MFETDHDNTSVWNWTPDASVAWLSEGPQEEGPPLLPSRYGLGEQIGRGGMARVFEAHDAHLDRPIAVKVALADNAEALARFRSEARVTGRLDHPNVLPVYDLGVDEQGVPFFTMKVVRDHQTVADLIKNLSVAEPRGLQRFTFQRRVALIQEVARALSEAHRAGLLHRDVKSANVVLGTGGEVYLADWGLAEEEGAGFEDERFVTGTPAYMAPELLQGDPHTQRGEVYALTATLYELLTLTSHLGDASSLDEVVKANEKEPVWADRFISPGFGRVPRALARVCAKGLARDPSKRYATVEEFSDDLQLWQDGRAPVICSGTFLQRALGAWSRQIDQHTYLGPLVSYALIATLLSCALRVLA
jgi:serine/threonine-protein kinase